MKTRAYFENIQGEIIKELSSSNNSIKIAVAWFTDKEIFISLCKKIEEGLEIEIILLDDEINRSSGINYDLLKQNKGKVWFINYSEELPLMHNKFCIIDNNIVINGSYNWTNKAKRNHESITIIKDNKELIDDFISEFEKIKFKYFGEQTGGLKLDYKKIYLRVEALKNAIKLEDRDDVNYQLAKMKKIFSLINDENEKKIILKIITQTEKFNYSDSINLINDYLNKYQSIVKFVDEELVALKIEAKALEIQISSIEDEVSEIEKIIHDFEIAYNNVLGELIIQILRLRREKYKKDAEKDSSKQHLYDEAEKDFKDFNEKHNKTKSEKHIDLTDEERKTLKDKFRQASKYCHPDVVASQFKQEAEKIFISLKNAYDNNDLHKVDNILSNLKKGKFVNKSSEINEKDTLHITIINLREKRDYLENRLISLKQMKTFQTIIEISDWAEYFEKVKKDLIKELNYLKENG